MCTHNFHKSEKGRAGAADLDKPVGNWLLNR